jgi:AcrR family transcriptional regulator
MSGKTGSTASRGTVDRRVRRTKRSLMEAAASLAQSRPYEEIRVAEILDAADVGRSTFYEHYRDKDHVLVASMAGMLDVLAEAPFADCDLVRLERVLAHLGEKRRLARRLFSGAASRHTAARIARELAARIERRLSSQFRPSGSAPVPRRLAAAQTARAELGALTAWLASAESGDVGTLATALHRGMQALLDSLAG